MISICAESLTVPHPYFWDRAFVLEPFIRVWPISYIKFGIEIHKDIKIKFTVIPRIGIILIGTYCNGNILLRFMLGDS